MAQFYERDNEMEGVYVACSRKCVSQGINKYRKMANMLK